jgi:hypothetical protein
MGQESDKKKGNDVKKISRNRPKNLALQAVFAPGFAWVTIKNEVRFPND